MPPTLWNQRGPTADATSMTPAASSASSPLAIWPPVLLTPAAAGVRGDLMTLALSGATQGEWLILAVLLLQAGLAFGSAPRGAG